MQSVFEISVNFFWL